MPLGKSNAVQGQALAELQVWKYPSLIFQTLEQLLWKFTTSLSPAGHHPLHWMLSQITPLMVVAEFWYFHVRKKKHVKFRISTRGCVLKGAALSSPTVPTAQT